MRLNETIIIPTTGLREFVFDLARKHNIAYVHTYFDEWAETVTRLCDDDIVSDDVENLIIALARAHVITGGEMVKILSKYLHEEKIKHA